MMPIVLYGVAAISLVAAGTRAISAHGQRSNARDQFSRINEQTAELVALRRGAPEANLPSVPETRLAARVSDELSQAGLSASSIQSLSPESETTDRGVLRQHATLVLTGLTLPKLGKFVEGWRERQPWVISGLEVSPAGSASPGSDLPLRIVITLDAAFKGGKSAHSGISR